MIKFPRIAIASVARALRGINANVETTDEGCDVRLQVYPNGAWIVRSGDSQYDTDHTGFWGAASVPGVVAGKVRRFDSLGTAKDLVEQAREQAALESE